MTCFKRRWRYPPRSGGAGCGPPGEPGVRPRRRRACFQRGLADRDRGTGPPGDQRGFCRDTLGGSARTAGRATACPLTRAVRLETRPRPNLPVRTGCRRPPRRGLIRSARVCRVPYRVVYVVHDEMVRVLAVAHIRREPRYWLGRSAPRIPGSARCGPVATGALLHALLHFADLPVRNNKKSQVVSR